MITLNNKEDNLNQVGSNLKADNLEGFFFPIKVDLFGTNAATPANYDVFFTADFPCEVIEALETHRVAATAGTLDIERLTSGTALDSGSTILATTFDLTATANTPQRKLATINTANKVLKPKDRLALKDSGALTNLAGLSVTVYIRPIFFKLQNT